MYKRQVEEGVEVTMPDKYKTFEEYGIENVADPAESGKAGYTILSLIHIYPEKDADKNKVMKINERWEALKEKSHANIQSEKGILNLSLIHIYRRWPRCRTG